jgi:hypothetical protein
VQGVDRITVETVPPTLSPSDTGCRIRATARSIDRRGGPLLHSAHLLGFDRWRIEVADVFFVEIAIDETPTALGGVW